MSNFQKNSKNYGEPNITNQLAGSVEQRPLGIFNSSCPQKHYLSLNFNYKAAGERLGTKNGYNGYARADFIKAMFTDVMKDIEQDSIRNFKFQPNKDSIVIDEPDEDGYHFHIK